MHQEVLAKNWMTRSALLFQPTDLAGLNKLLSDNKLEVISAKK
ncbi:MAG: hypothetical protein ACKVZH_20370 [Blastocatellia bacterium]